MKVSDLKDILTRRGKMRLTEDEFEDLMSKISPQSLETGTIDYKELVELFVTDYRREVEDSNDEDDYDDSSDVEADEDQNNFLKVPQNNF